MKNHSQFMEKWRAVDFPVSAVEYNQPQFVRL
jgi:hypothetical protein